MNLPPATRGAPSSARRAGPFDLRIVLVAALSLVSQACAAGSGAAPSPAGPTVDPAANQTARAPAEAPTRPDPAHAAQPEAPYHARPDSALTGYHAADVHFMTGMIGHHAQALVMAGFAPDNGASPSIQVLCARIINAQQDEIHVMQAWLRDRDLEVPEIHIEGDRLMVHGPEHAMHMPGMLTQEELSELGRAQGPDFDRLFLAYMIKHHNGAVHMVNELFATDGAALGDFVFKLASDIQADQGSEIARMELMLEALTP